MKTCTLMETSLKNAILNISWCDFTRLRIHEIKINLRYFHFIHYISVYYFKDFKDSLN